MQRVLIRERYAFTLRKERFKTSWAKFITQKNAIFELKGSNGDDDMQAAWLWLCGW